MTVTSKQCFGPYSCVYTYAVTARYNSTTQRPLPLVTLTYTVTGGDQGQIDSISFVPSATDYTNPMRAVAMAPDGATFVATPTQVMWR